MKIDNNTQNILSGATDPLAPASPTSPTSAGGAAKTSGPGTNTDQVTVSADALLLKAATDAATVTPEIRADLVARMRALLDRGEVGDDAARLAEALIDDLVKNT